MYCNSLKFIGDIVSGPCFSRALGVACLPPPLERCSSSGRRLRYGHSPYWESADAYERTCARGGANTSGDLSSRSGEGSSSTLPHTLLFDLVAVREGVWRGVPTLLRLKLTDAFSTAARAARSIAKSVSNSLRCACSPVRQPREILRRTRVSFAASSRMFV